MRAVFNMRWVIIALAALVTAATGLQSFFNLSGGSTLHDGPVVVRVYRHDSGLVQEVPLEEYVAGVVAAEMPAEFPVEALKAQAVAARTYVLKRIMAGGVENSVHPGADVCDDHRHGQAFMSREEMRERWGTLNYYRYYYKIRQAVADTAGEVITYRGELIDPVFHSCCGGRTENSEDVWKYAVPYLRSVPCYCAEGDGVQRERVKLSLDEIVQAFNGGSGVLPASTGAARRPLLEVLERTGTGRPKTLRVGAVEVPATLLRERLGLRSTNFEWEIEGDEVTFTTVGYGHGVGMCQYGAREMAARGRKYDEILTHYYTGVRVERVGGTRVE